MPNYIQELQRINELQRRTLASIQGGLDEMRFYLDLDKFKGTDPRDGSSNDWVHVSDVLLRLPSIGDGMNQAHAEMEYEKAESENLAKGIAS